MEITMARVRSPNYPAISLADAIQRVGQVFAKERQHPAPQDAVVKGMGYGGVNGASLGALSAAIKYGLLDKAGKDYRVSDRTVVILHPHNPMEKADAIRDASKAPKLFLELLEHFSGGDLPSDDTLRAYLVRRGFSEAALGDVIRSFRETMDLVSKEAGGYSATAREQGTDMSMRPAATQSMHRAEAGSSGSRYETTFGRGGNKEPFRVSFTGSGIEITGRVSTPEDADDLVRAVNALKILLKPAGQAVKPDWADKTFMPGERVPASTPFKAEHIGHVPADVIIEPEEGDAFPACDQCIGGPVRYTLA
jgi:hypothetical protein